jgi:flavin-binding protein dodecin
MVAAIVTALIAVTSGGPASRGHEQGFRGEEFEMADAVYRVTEVIGVSTESWEKAAQAAVETAAKTVRDLRVAEVVRQDVTIKNGQIKAYRVRLGISFKYESED